MNKPFINVTRVNLKGVETELRRIADALEAYLAVAHNYHMRAPQPIAGGDEEATVAYADDATSARQEIMDDLVRAGIIARPDSEAKEETE